MGQPTSESDPPPNPGPFSPNEPGVIFTANLKGQELANYAADTLDDLTQHARRGITRVRRRRRLLFAFLDRTGLSI